MSKWLASWCKKSPFRILNGCTIVILLMLLGLVYCVLQMVFQKPLCQIAKKARCFLNLMILLLHSDSDGPKVSNKSDWSTFDFVSFCLFKEDLTSCHIIIQAILIPLVIIIEKLYALNIVKIGIRYHIWQFYLGNNFRKKNQNLHRRTLVYQKSC